MTGRESFKYDGYDLTPLLLLEEIRRNLLPDIKTTINSGSSDGGSVMRVQLETGTIETDVRLMDFSKVFDDRIANLASLRRRVAGLLFRRKPCKLVLPDEDDIYYLAILDGSTDMDSLSSTRSTTLNWLCPDPVSYGRRRRKKSEGGKLNIQVDGTYPMTPIITAEADGPFDLLIDDAQFIVKGKPEGSTVIDCRNPLFWEDGHTVKNKGKDVPYSINSDFFEVEPGRHLIRCDIPLEITWEERWL